MSEENVIVSDIVKKNVGKLFQEEEETELIIWKIPNFTKKLSGPPRTYYESPTFVFSDMCWFLFISPNGEKVEGFEDCIALYLCLKGEHSCCTITCTLSIRSAKGVSELSKIFEHEFERGENGYDYDGWDVFCTKSKLTNRKSELLPDDTLTVECRLIRNKSSLLGVYRIGQLLNLQRDFKKILTDKENCDVVFKVDGEEIKAHKLILMSRSEVFESMLSHWKTLKITIHDIEPDVFKQVLAYMYCGEVENLSTENMCQLYVAADKYHLDELKALCATFIGENISLDVFCDILANPDTCIDAELMLLLEDFFSKNIGSIIDTEQWKSLHEKNMEITYQLLLSTWKANLEAREATEVSSSQSKTDAAMKTIEDTAVSSVPSELEDEATEVSSGQSETDAAMKTIKDTAASSVPSELEDAVTYGVEFGAMREGRFDVEAGSLDPFLWFLLSFYGVWILFVLAGVPVFYP